jgi:uncharacterized protein YchJ
MSKPPLPCPCGQPLTYAACCGRAQPLHETSRFVRREDRWFCLDGDIQ